MEQGLQLCSFTELLTQLPGLHWWQHSNGSSCAFSPACQALVQTAAPLSAASWQALIHPHDRPKRQAALKLSSGQETSIKYRVLIKENTYQWINESIKATYTADAGLVYLSSATTEKAALYRSIFNNTASLLVLLDLQGNIEEANDKALTFIVNEWGEVWGKPVWQQKSFRWGADGGKQLEEAVDQAAQGKTVMLKQLSISLQHLSLTGDFLLKPLRNREEALEYLLLESITLHEQLVPAATSEVPAKEAAHNKEALFSLTEGTPKLTFAFDKQYRLISFNKAFEQEIQRIFGKTPTEGVSIKELLSDYPAELENALDLFNRALKGEEFTIQQEFGDWHRQRNYYEISFSSIRNQHGQLTGASSRTRNISQKRNIHKELKDAREFLILAENLPQIIFTARPDGQIDYLNQAFYQYTNLRHLLQRPLNWKQVVHPEDYHSSLRQWLSAVKTKSPGIQLELRLRSRHGVYRWHVARAVPLFNNLRQVVKWVGVISDIHETRLISEQERIAAEEFKTIANSLPHIVWTARTNGQLSYFNHKWYDYSGEVPDTQTATDWIQHIHAGDQQRTAKAWQKALDNSSYYQVEYRLRHKSGRYRWFLARGVPLTNADGQVIKWFGTCTDIHENKLQRKRLQTQNQRLQQINHYLDNFVHAAAHDLRSPLANMKGLLQLLHATKDAAKGAKVMQSMEQSLYRLDNTLQAMIHSIELQSLKQSPAKRLDLEVVFNQVHLEFSERLQQVPHEIHTSFEACTELVFIPFYLESLFRNLLSNAIKYRKENQKLLVHLSCRPYRKYKLLQFSDNGIGIDVEKYRDKLFKPFQRFTQQAAGKGIGLHLINNIITKTGGKIEVKSKPGEGTTFMMYLNDLEAS